MRRVGTTMELGRLDMADELKRGVRGDGWLERNSSVGA